MRIDAPGLTHHVVATGNGRRPIVLDDTERIRLVGEIARVSTASRWKCQAYCVMDTHLHLVVFTPEATLGAGMRRLLGAYARWFNQRHGGEGHLWGPRYFSSVIDAESYLLQACAYIVLNPVRAGICRHPRDWRWSSYRSTAGIDPTAEALGADLLLAALDLDPVRARRRWCRFVERALSEPARDAGWTAVSD